MKVLRFNEVKKLINMSRSSLARWEKAGTFPERVVLGENSVGWLEEEIMEWIRRRIERK